MTTLAWVVHNNASCTARLIIEGMKQLGRNDISHTASREDTLGLREPRLHRADTSSIGVFPDAASFVPNLATPSFWQRLESADFIVFTVNAGENHNAFRAAEIIRKKDLFHKLVYLDEDERGSLHPDLRDIFLKARLAFVWRPRLYRTFEVHPYVVNFGFNGVEQRYLKYNISPEHKTTSVFYRGRLEHRPQRAPFIEALRNRSYSDSNILPRLRENATNEDLIYQFVSGNRHNVDYFEQLAKAKICVVLHGGNPVGYQFWEGVGLNCAIVTQGPHATEWYAGGSYPAVFTDYEKWEPPFEPGQHFLTFESPAEMLDRIDYLLENDEVRSQMARSAHELAVTHYTERARAERFLTYLFRKP